MKKKAALIVIYNHNYEKNIEKIKRIYGSRFSCLLQLMPFYRGDDPTVIPVYEASWQFQGYLQQALPAIMQQKDCSHYVFVGDDFILNPELNEWNICDKLGLDENCAYVDKMDLVDEDHLENALWPQYSFNKFLCPLNRCEFHRFIPSLEEARACCVRHGYDWKKGVRGYYLHHCMEEKRFNSKGINMYYKLRYRRGMANFFAGLEIGLRKLFGCKVDEDAIRLKHNQKLTKRKLTTEYHYPLFHGFVDIMAIPVHKMEEFAYVCGVFAAGRVFVETAAPTALVLTMDKIRTFNDLNCERVIVWGDDQRDALVTEHQGSFAHLTEHWPAEVIYYHPVKLSQWKMDV